MYSALCLSEIGVPMHQAKQQYSHYRHFDCTFNNMPPLSKLRRRSYSQRSLSVGGRLFPASHLDVELSTSRPGSLAVESATIGRLFSQCSPGLLTGNPTEEAVASRRACVARGNRVSSVAAIAPCEVDSTTSIVANEAESSIHIGHDVGGRTDSMLWTAGESDVASEMNSHLLKERSSMYQDGVSILNMDTGSGKSSFRISVSFPIEIV
ncbi:unnamed protein product [Protopolystoma xenopodis]|uniref:Uncharacterized protein n=1 Tax=Protopolystoma xenopodis TaxID=117903 RepID=A0A3S5APF6_9PLAT|nr:unnamed protein product [Protopolystoma xenopodis]